jgi:hypothetical protein
MNSPYSLLALPSFAPASKEEFQRTRQGEGVSGTKEEEESERLEAALKGKRTVKGLADLERKPKHPTAKNKLFIRDLSDLRIKHVNSKTVAFRRDLLIRGLRSTIRATVQKVKFLVNSGASLNQI